MRGEWPTEGRTAGQRVGEVVESASHQFIAQCYRLYQSPPLGAFVCTESHPAEDFNAGSEGETARIYAVVNGVSTRALDPGRPVIARGEDEDREEDVYRSNPQLERLLCTRFEAQTVGHGDSAEYYPYLPPLPPRIHAFVYACSPNEVERCTHSLDFLNLLVSSSPADRGITDEVIAACLRQASSQLEDARNFLVQAGKVLAVHLAGDLPRLNSILRRLSPWPMTSETD